MKRAIFSRGSNIRTYPNRLSLNQIARRQAEKPPVRRRKIEHPPKPTTAPAISFQGDAAGIQKKLMPADISSQGGAGFGGFGRQLALCLFFRLDRGMSAP